MWSEVKWKSLIVSDSLQPHGLYGPRDSPGQNTGVGSLSLLQGIFPTQRLNLHLLNWQSDPLPLTTREFLSIFDTIFQMILRTFWSFGILWKLKTFSVYNAVVILPRSTQREALSWLNGKEYTSRRHRFDPWLGRCPGGSGNLLQYSCLGNPMDWGAWWATVIGLEKE